MKNNATNHNTPYVRNNVVQITGQVVTPFIFNHKAYGESFYVAKLRVNRRSSNSDIIPFMISDHIINTDQSLEGKMIRLSGEFRSYNLRFQGRYRLLLVLFVSDYQLPSDPAEEPENEIYVEGYICRPPFYKRYDDGTELSDMVVAVNRRTNKSDYLPCICWGRNARYASSFTSGTHVRLNGSIRSRQKKVYIDEVCESTTVYEISVKTLEKL